MRKMRSVKLIGLGTLWNAVKGFSIRQVGVKSDAIIFLTEIHTSIHSTPVRINMKHQPIIGRETDDMRGSCDVS